jgi:hypothetical protein
MNYLALVRLRMGAPGDHIYDQSHGAKYLYYKLERPQWAI